MANVSCFGGTYALRGTSHREGSRGGRAAERRGFTEWWRTAEGNLQVDTWGRCAGGAQCPGGEGPGLGSGWGRTPTISLLSCLRLEAWRQKLHPPPTPYVLSLVRVSRQTTHRRRGQRDRPRGTGLGGSGAARPKAAGRAGRLGTQVRAGAQFESELGGTAGRISLCSLKKTSFSENLRICD